MEIAASLHTWRLRAGLTQEELAERSGVSVRTISGLEAGQRTNPRPASLRLLADALGLSDAERAALTASARGLRGTAGAGSAVRAGTDTRASASASTRTEPGTGAGSGARVAAAPRIAANSLPYALADFVGRESALAVLSQATEYQDHVTIAAIDGMAGVGKTAFVVQASHLLAPRFEDGCIFLDLHGFTPGRQPTETGEALGRLLTTVGLSPDELPSGEAARADLWRATVADRRMLLVLDNAPSAAAVLPLIAAGPGSLVLTTSRRRLLIDGAIVISLGILDAHEALALFSRGAGETRAAAEPGAAMEVVHQLGRLPLALRIAAARLAHRPAWTIADLAARLAAQERPLAELSVGDRDVATAFGVSYEQLGADERRVFTLLGLHPGHDFDAYAIAALSGLRLPDAELIAESLVDEHMVLAIGPGRYSLHDLLRAHAQALAAALPEATRAAAAAALAHHHRYTAARAVNLIWPDTASRRPTVPAAASPEVPLPDADAARAWLDAEQWNLITMAVEGGVPGHAGVLSVILGRHLDFSGRNGDAIALHQAAADDARARGDHTALASALSLLGITHAQLGANLQAADYLQQSRETAKSAGDAGAQMRATVNLAVVYEYLGRYTDALAEAQHGLELARQLGDPAIIGASLNNVGTMLERLGRPAEAVGFHEEALNLAAEHGLASTQARALHYLGRGLDKLGRPKAALRHHCRALRIYRRLQDPRSQADALSDIGLALAHLGRGEQAIRAQRKALDLAIEADAPGVQAKILNELGDAYCALASAIESASADAIDAYRRARALAVQVADTAQKDRADAALRALGYEDSENEEEPDSLERSTA